MHIDYIDALQVHNSYVSKIPLLDTYEEINRLVEKGKVRFLSASNTSLAELQELQKHFKLTSFEGVYNLECKYYENVGLLDFCQENNIQFVCYQALRRNQITKMNYPFLVHLADKYHKTQNQILLNWLVKEKNLKPIVKTTTLQNIDDNLSSLDFTIEPDDIQLLNCFQDERFNAIEIDWKNQGGITIDKLASQLNCSSSGHKAR